MPAKTTLREAIVECLDCGSKFTLKGRIDLGQAIVCPDCEASMEVVSLDPVAVDWIYEEPEYDENESQDW